jgi:hypothetical protein
MLLCHRIPTSPRWQHYTPYKKSSFDLFVNISLWPAFVLKAVFSYHSLSGNVRTSFLVVPYNKSAIEALSYMLNFNEI